MYEKLEPLNSVQHAKLRYREPENLGYTRGAQSAPLVISEFAEAQKAFPIVFAPSGKEGLIPMALLGLKPGENLLVGADGRWEGHYIPAFLRRYPFMVTEPEQGKLQLLIDRSYPGFSEETGEPLFADGQESELLKRKLEFVRHYHRDALATKAFVSRIQALDLFADMKVNVQIPGKEGSTALGGFSVIDENKLKTLAADKIVQLFSSGELAAIYAHAFSLSSMKRLIDAAVRHDRVVH